MNGENMNMDKKYCLIGKSLPYSLSADVHRRFGLDYKIEELPDANALDGFIKHGDYDGFNITIPYKEDVIKYLDYVSPDAKEIGAVNTVVRKNGKLCGYNTDRDGFLYGLKKAGIDASGRTVAVLGSGGTSKTVRAALGGTAKTIYVVSRKGDVNYNNVYSLTDVEIIVNTTPVGTYPDNFSAPVDVKRFPHLVGVFDAVYNPLTTRLVADAEETGLRASNGLYMLVEQARLARDVFTDTTSRKELTDEVVTAIRRERSNVVLTGMPGAGKTSVGKEVANTLKRDFFDVDCEIEKATGKSAADIIKKEGEARFREIEKGVVACLSKRTGAVIATGGGSVLDKENVRALKQNGIIFYLIRPLNLLPTDNRPLSKNGVENLYNARRQFYTLAADITVDGSSTVTAAAKEIIEKYEKHFSD